MSAMIVRCLLGATLTAVLALGLQMALGHSLREAALTGLCGGVGAFVGLLWVERRNAARGRHRPL
jgi:hypothetical protein